MLGLEHPEIWGGLVDLEPAAAAPEPLAAEPAAQIVDEAVDEAVDEDIDEVVGDLCASDGEDMLAWRNGRRLVPRLVPRTAGELPPPARLRADATYLVTGGLRGIGLQIARWLVDSGARHLVITGRQGLPPRARWHDPEAAPHRASITAIQDMESQGATVHAVAADVCDPARMAALFGDIAARGAPLAGIIHAAGTSRPMMLADTAADTVAYLLAPKVRGTRILDRLSRACDLDFFVLMSSAAAVWGGAGLGPYAAANTYLDMTAHHRRALGLPAVSIDWGGWEGGGMVEAMPEEIRSYFFDLLGYELIPGAQSLAVLGRFLAAPMAQRVVAAVDWNRFKPIFEARRRRPLLDPIQVREAEQTGAGSHEILAALQGAEPDARLGLLVRHVRHRVAQVLSLSDPAVLELDQGFFQMGMDSIMSVKLRRQLEADLGLALPPTVAFEHPTVGALARFLLAQDGPWAAAAETTAASADRAGAGEGVAADHASAQAPAGQTHDHTGGPIGNEIGNPLGDPADDEAGDDLSEDELLALLAQELSASAGSAETSEDEEHTA